MKGLIGLGGVKVSVFCFKQLPLNTKQKYKSPYQLIDGEKLLSVMVGGRFFDQQTFTFPLYNKKT